MNQWATGTDGASGSSSHGSRCHEAGVAVGARSEQRRQDDKSRQTPSMPGDRAWRQTVSCAAMMKLSPRGRRFVSSLGSRQRCLETTLP